MKSLFKLIAASLVLVAVAAGAIAQQQDKNCSCACCSRKESSAGVSGHYSRLLGEPGNPLGATLRSPIDSYGVKAEMRISGCLQEFA